MTVSAVPSPGGRSGARAPRRRAGKVELKARAVLREIDTDHAAAELLSAVAVRLAQDIDEAPAVRDRCAASKELREVLAELDTAVIPPRMPAAAPAGASEGGDDSDDDDVFQVGAGPAFVVDPTAS